MHGRDSVRHTAGAHPRGGAESGGRACRCDGRIGAMATSGYVWLLAMPEGREHDCLTRQAPHAILLPRHQANAKNRRLVVLVERKSAVAWTAVCSVIGT